MKSVLIKRIYLTLLHRFSLSCFLFIAFSFASTAQDQSNFTQFYLNPYIINSSYAGIDGRTSISIIYRRQWMNIEGGPAIANFSLHTPVTTRVTTGLSVTSDKRGLLNNTSLLLTFGYNLPIKASTFLRFGLSAGGAWNTVDLQKLEGINDPEIGKLLDNNMSIAGNAGISFHASSFHAGISIPHIFEPSYTSESGFSITKVNPFHTSLIHVSNRFYFNKNKNVFEPYLIYRLNSGLPSQFEFAGILHLNHVVWVGGSYKQDFGISALGGIKLQNSLAIGGSYSLKNSGINELNSPTFEVSLNYLFGKKKKEAPVYSFVDTQKEKPKVVNKAAAAALAKKKADEEKKKAQAKLNKEEQEKLRKQQEAALALHREEIRKKEEARKHEVIKTPVVKKDSVLVHNPRFNQELSLSFEIPEGHHEHEQEQIKRLETHAENPIEEHGETHHPHAERHEFVKRGGHKEELEVADYVVGGVFKNVANAKHYADGLIKLGFEADFGHLTEKDLWYVYLIQTKDINEARSERDRYRKMKIFRDAWLLTVHH